MSGLVFRFEMRLAFDAPMRYDSLSGARGFVRLTGGGIEGPGVTASLLPDGGDFGVHRRDGVEEFDGRYVGRTEDGLVLYVQNRGLVHDRRDCRCTPRFEVTPGRLDWLSRGLFVGVGERGGQGATIRCFEVT